MCAGPRAADVGLAEGEPVHAARRRAAGHLDLDGPGRLRAEAAGRVPEADHAALPDPRLAQRLSRRHQHLIDVHRDRRGGSRPGEGQHVAARARALRIGGVRPGAGRARGASDAGVQEAIQLLGDRRHRCGGVRLQQQVGLPSGRR